MFLKGHNLLVKFYPFILFVSLPVVLFQLCRMNNSIYIISVTDEKLHLWISVIQPLVAGPQLLQGASQIYMMPWLLDFAFGSLI